MGIGALTAAAERRGGSVEEHPLIETPPPAAQATFCLEILGVKKNPNGPMYSSMGVMTKVGFCRVVGVVLWLGVVAAASRLCVWKGCLKVY